MKAITLIIALVFSLVTGPAVAEKRVSDRDIYYQNPNSQCPMTENSQINVNFNSQETDLKRIKNIMDEKIRDIEALAKEAGVEVFDMQSMNYNVNVNNYNRGNCSPACDGNNVYQLSGNINFIAFPSDKATDLMMLLNRNGYTCSLNVNKYRQCR